MRGEVLERYPNGNYKIKALKRILYKKGNPRLISLVGTIKGNDISEDTETVLSSKLYNYHLEVLSLLR